MVGRRTHKGNTIDIDSLINSAPVNEPAVGNMRVNAHGDVLGQAGDIIQKNEDRVRAYYKDNPKSSTSRVSLGGNETSPQPDAVSKSNPQPDAAQPAPAEPEEFDAPLEPLGYKEVELPNGDIDLVPYYKEDDK